MISIAGLSCEMFKVSCIKLTSFILSHRLLPMNLEYFGIGKNVNFSVQNIKYECFESFFLLRETCLRSCLVRKKSLQSAARLGAV